MVREYLRELTSLIGVSSREDALIEYMVRKFQNYGDDVHVDNLGNVVLKLSSQAANPQKLLVFAHMDEIGFIVRKIEKNGFIRIERIGGVSTQILPGLVIELQGRKGDVKGIIGTPAHHFIKVEDKFSVPQVADMYVDVGAASDEQVRQMGIDVGCFGAFEGRYLEMPNDIVCGKALDDRAGLAILLQFLDETKGCRFDWDVYVVAAVQEEFNIRGIMPAVHRIQPDAMLGIDITPSCDTPDMSYNDVVLGKGPAVCYMNFHGGGTLAGMLPDKKMLEHLEQALDSRSISYQKEISPGVITENAFTLWENQGIPVCNLSIPTRYTHTPVECVHIGDLEKIAAAIAGFATDLRETTRFGKGT